MTIEGKCYLVYSERCYHGTEAKSGREIVHSSEFIIPPFDKQYLGEGVYFFENDPEGAFRWCRIKKYKSFFVIEALVMAENVFDLFVERDKISLRKTITRIKLGLLGTQYGKKDFLDGLAINYIYQYICKFDLVRAPFFMGNSYTANRSSRIHDFFVYVCVRNTECVKEMKRYQGEAIGKGRLKG